MGQKLWKLAGNRQSYCKNYLAYFFWPTLYICCFITTVHRSLQLICNMHCGTCYFTNMKNHMDMALFLFSVIHINFNFLEKTMRSVECTYVQLLQDFTILSRECISIRNLTFLGHVTSWVTWSLFPRYVVSYRCGIDINRLSWAVCEMLSLKHIWVATLTLSVTWPLAFHGPFPIGVPLSPKDFEILRLIYIWVLIFLGHVTSSVTWPFAYPRVIFL